MMQNVYKIFLVLFIVFIGFNLYAFDWERGILHEDNTRYLFSMVAAIVGILVVYVLNTWSKLPAKK